MSTEKNMSIPSPYIGTGVEKVDLEALVTELNSQLINYINLDLKTHFDLLSLRVIEKKDEDTK